jgi:hypothetical protein
MPTGPAGVKSRLQAMAKIRTAKALTIEKRGAKFTLHS